ncbi:MAG: tautomerase family protein [Lachnospiraceae bacterium]|nr:tautomerase family protein [Lachnospiraceae bacterium]
MPHIIVKLWPGRNEEIKKSLADRIAATVAEELKVDKGDVSVALEEVAREDWGDKVYKAEIKDSPNLYHKPDYEYE